MEIPFGIDDPESLQAIKQLTKRLQFPFLFTYELESGEDVLPRHIRGFGNLTMEDAIFWSHHLLTDMLGKLGYDMAAEQICVIVHTAMDDAQRRRNAWLS